MRVLIVGCSERPLHLNQLDEDKIQTISNNYFIHEITQFSNAQNDALELLIKLSPVLCGGKGGFGSMLKSIGSQISKTKNRESCRDLNSGQRLVYLNRKKRANQYKNNKKDQNQLREEKIAKLKSKLAKNVENDNQIMATMTEHHNRKEIIEEKNREALEFVLNKEPSYLEKEKKKPLKRDLLKDFEGDSTDSE
ncbi:MAG: silencing defective protein Sde2 [Paramarteilia canceri]